MHVSIPGAGYVRFLSLAGWLQITVGDRDIFLPTRALGGLLGVSAVTVSRWRAAGIADGFLSKTGEREFRSQGGSTATEFRFDVSRVPMLAERAYRARRTFD